MSRFPWLADGIPPGRTRGSTSSRAVAGGSPGVVRTRGHGATRTGTCAPHGRMTDCL